MLCYIMLCCVMLCIYYTPLLLIIVQSVASVLIVTIIEEVLNIHVFIIFMLQWLFYCEFLGLL